MCACVCARVHVESGGRGFHRLLAALQIGLSHLMRKDDLSPQRFPASLIGSSRAS